MKSLGGALWLMLWSLTMTVCSAEEQNVGFTQHFQNDWAVGWTMADYTFSHPHFDTDWSASQIALKNGVQLSLSPNVKGTNNFLGASFRRETTSHYGRYEVVIQPARGEGVVTGFFSYTGPYYGTRHDEIDRVGFRQRCQNADWRYRAKHKDHDPKNHESDSIIAHRLSPLLQIRGLFRAVGRITAASVPPLTLDLNAA